MDKLCRFSQFISEQQNPQQQAKDVQIKADVDKQLLDIDKRISEVDLALANIQKREKDGTLTKSDSFTQQANELQKRVKAAEQLLRQV